MALIDGQPRSASATAAENCELMVIDRRNSIPFIHEHPEVAVKLLELLCARLRQSNEQVEDVMFASLPVRLARAIVKLAKTIDPDTPAARVVITQRELSQMIGISREGTNKQLRAWKSTDGYGLNMDRSPCSTVARCRGSAKKRSRKMPAKSSSPWRASIARFRLSQAFIRGASGAHMLYILAAP